MLDNLNKTIKKEKECKISSDSSLSRDVDMITKIKKNNNMSLSDFDSFQENLKQEILEKRHKQLSMKNNNLSFLLRPQFAVFTLMLLLVASITAIGINRYYPKGQDNVVAGKNQEKSVQEVKKTIRKIGKKMFELTLVKPVFAEFKEMKSNLVPVLTAGKIKISQLANFKDFSKKHVFNNEQKQALEEQGFFLTKNNITTKYIPNDDFVDIYSDVKGGKITERAPQNSVFVSSDIALHTFHKLIDKSFEEIEQTKFQPALKNMTKVLFEDSLEKYKEETDPQLKESYKRVATYYLVPLVILSRDGSIKSEIKKEDFSTYGEYLDAIGAEKEEELFSEDKVNVLLNSSSFNGYEIDKEIYDVAKEELRLINAANRATISPLFSPFRKNPLFINDYTQFKPRAHYTKNNILKTYFMSMMWYGRMGFTLNSKELTRDALVITGQINTLKVGDKKIAEEWGKIMAVIDFFVGDVDDLTAFEYTEAMKNVFGDEITSDELLDDEQLDRFIEYAVKNLPQPKILSEVLVVDKDAVDEEVLKGTLQFRFMGQRFTPDAYILNKFTQAISVDKETGQKLPSTPTSLMPFSVISPDNNIVKKYLDKWIGENANNSDKVIAKVYKKLKIEFSEYDNKIWTKNIYWNWLDGFKILLRRYGKGYPYFMQTEAWQKKSLNTVLGSYTELKHDTLLYSKQSYAELGGGGGDIYKIPPVPKGYVEADLEFWNKIINLSEMTQKGLEDLEVFPEKFKDKYNSYISTSKFLRDIVKKELKNEKISDDDFETLRNISAQFLTVVQPFSNEELTLKEKRAGIIADIHTDAIKGKILYEATGKPNIIYVAVSDINGTRLTKGAVFSHYEFTKSISDGRMSDEEWQAKVYDLKGELPREDEWVMEIKK